MTLNASDVVTRYGLQGAKIMKSGRSNPKVIVLLVGLVVVVAYLLVWRPRVAEVADAQANR